MSEPAIGDVPRVDLEIHQGSDISFEFQWWLDAAETQPMPLSGAFGAVKDDSTEVEFVLDFADYINVNANSALVMVPANVTVDIEPFQRGVWDFTLIAETGERKKVARGNVACHKSVGSEA